MIIHYFLSIFACAITNVKGRGGAEKRSVVQTLRANFDILVLSWKTTRYALHVYPPLASRDSEICQMPIVLYHGDDALFESVLRDEMVY